MHEVINMHSGFDTILNKLNTMSVHKIFTIFHRKFVIQLNVYVRQIKKKKKKLLTGKQAGRQTFRQK